MSASSSSGSTSTPASGGTNSGGPPTRVATTERPEAMASSVARPNGSTRLGWQTTSAAAIQRGHVVVRHAADQRGSPPTFERAAERAVADERRACPRRAARTRARAGGRSCAPSARRGRGTPCRSPSSRARARGLAPSRGREALEVDAAVDDLGLPGRVGDGLFEPLAQPAGDRDDRRRAADDVTRRWRVRRDRADVRDVLPVRRDDERRA